MSDLDDLAFKNGVRIVFGLEQQGHIPFVEEKLKEWRPSPFSNENTFYIWKEIAQQIGWLDYAVCEGYIRYLKRGKEELEAKVKELEDKCIEAFMAGQSDCGVDPSYSSAVAWAKDNKVASDE